MNADLFTLYELQRKEHIHACMLLERLDDQDPNGWSDMEFMTDGDLNFPVAIMPNGVRATMQGRACLLIALLVI